MAKQKLFFSYSRIDGSDYAQRLAGDLKKNGFDIWIDLEDIKAGSKWDKEIERALESCDCLLFLETEQSVNSTNVLDEVYYALEQNKPVIPLIFVDSNTPFRLKRLQHIDFTKDYKAGLASLVKELGEDETAITSNDSDKKTESARSWSFFGKSNRLFFLITCLAIIMATVLLFNRNNSNAVPVEKNTDIVENDTLINHSNAGIKLTDTGNGYKTRDEVPIENRSPVIGRSGITNRFRKNIDGSVPNKPSATNNASKLKEKITGSWRLAATEPEAKSHQGYVKIEALDENNVSIKSYMQFYYPDSETTSYLTVFNAFAGCKSCSVSNEMALQAEDIAVGSRTIKTATKDQPDGQKEGDIILDASSNKSMRGTVSLLFPDSKTAVIRVTQPRTIMLAHDLQLEPFVYTFRFIKAD